MKTQNTPTRSSTAWPFPIGVVSQPVAQPVSQGFKTQPATGVPKARATSANKRWTDADLNRFADMLLTPASPSDIAKALGRTVSSIAHQIGDMSTQKTKTGKALAALVDAKRAAAAKPANHRATWDAAADKDLLIAFAAGKSPVEIASATGRTVAAINARLHALDMLSFDKDTMTYLTVPKVWFKVQV